MCARYVEKDAFNGEMRAQISTLQRARSTLRGESSALRVAASL
jgi:hypothetical protein